MKKIINWVIYSSSDPYKTSMTIKGILLGGATYLLFFANLFHVQLPETELNNLIEQIVKAVELLMQIISIFWVIYGSLRKIYLTLVAKNKVLNKLDY